MTSFRLFGFVALRGLVVVACAMLGAGGAAIVGAPFRSQQSTDWGFGWLMGALLIGGTVGVAIGFVLAVRLGRRWYDGPARVMQTLAALAISPLLAAGAWMERSHESNTPGLTVLPAEGTLAPPVGTDGTPDEVPPPAPSPARPTLPTGPRHRDAQ